MAGTVVFIDIEVSKDGKTVIDTGAFRSDKGIFHSPSVDKLYEFSRGADYVAGHNIIGHDLKYLKGLQGMDAIDTLYLSLLLFPQETSHKLGKDEKLRPDEDNNPASDSRKAHDLVEKEAAAFMSLPADLRKIYYSLLYDQKGFSAFFRLVGYEYSGYDNIDLIINFFSGRICSNANIPRMAVMSPVELAFALSLVNSSESLPAPPPYIVYNFPRVMEILHDLRHVRCVEGCPYCNDMLDLHKGLRKWFGYDEFRSFDGEPLQEKAAAAALGGESLLAIFPTGGGKSLSFQLPALMEGHATGSLTLVISPLVALMKDQVDSLGQKGITEAVTVNGLLDPVERAKSYERVVNGSAALLYLSPESLRSNTVERVLLDRDISRVVIDEAHCFSAWGQDFRVDYLYIAEFIKNLQDKKGLKKPIPVSCFTATAKQKVISDILEYFEKNLGLSLKLFASKAMRVNLHYKVLHALNDAEKYSHLRALLTESSCPAIVYCARIKTVREIAERLTSDGCPAEPFHGKMDASEKILVQDAFLRNEVRIMVATSAFGMGVDKKDIGLVIHYEISSSIEDYLQEAGRAGRDPESEADCYVLYSDNDMDKHFRLLKDTMLSFSELQRVWRVIKSLTKDNDKVYVSPLELARAAGWDENSYDPETRVKTAVSVLERSGYIKRGNNSPVVFATSIQVENMAQASERIDSMKQIDEEDKANAKRIMSRLISSRSISKAGNGDAESRIEYLADTLGLEAKRVSHLVECMRSEGLLADSKDMKAFLPTLRKSKNSLKVFQMLDEELISAFSEGEVLIDLRKLNESLGGQSSGANIKRLQSLLFFHVIQKEITKEGRIGDSRVKVRLLLETGKLRQKCQMRWALASAALEKLHKASSPVDSSGESALVEFSLGGLFGEITKDWDLGHGGRKPRLSDVEDALLYLSKAGILKIEGGFLVFYSRMEIQRLNMDSRSQFKKTDYADLDLFYRGKIQQIHIVGEFANMMLKNYADAIAYIGDYFNLDHRMFVRKYFSGRLEEISRCISKDNYDKLFGKLSERQQEIIDDTDSRRIVVAAGPGSGKTRVLVHKLAALRLLDEVKPEELLMLTFSRAAATEFRERLYALIGEAAAFVDIKTFHSFCFDLLGKEGNLAQSASVISQAVKLIDDGDAEPGKITKSVIVIDEAQDMAQDEHILIESLLRYNESIRLVAVGDDDQNIYQWRGSDSAYMASFAREDGAKVYEMTENYRSQRAVVAFANDFAESIKGRLKTAPITAVSKSLGSVRITKHASGNMEEAMVEELLSFPEGKKRCVLTRTNMEALQVYGLLEKKGIKAQLVQDMGRNVSLSSLAEIRYFLRAIDKDSPGALISESAWSGALGRMRVRYHDSSCLPLCERLLKAFASVNHDMKYRSDLEEFIKESKAEDFARPGSDSVYVSTIHKAKGREFDSVHMMLSPRPAKGEEDITDDERRVLYVGFTRAKEDLCIHYEGDLLDKYGQDNLPGLSFSEDRTLYDKPSEILFQMGYTDVVLDFFKDKKTMILKNLVSGMEMKAKGDYLVSRIAGEDVKVVKFSNAFRSRLESFARSGYVAVSAKISYILAWKAEGDEEESAVVLPCVKLERRPQFR